ncbi:gamma-glutamylcyclotransferase family protein [Aurantimonas sp. VKM B-3413]|uniref:gamma-glutamylcyclotransferase family protein n=1 Tax=Aurantimonas sp. VKM B-3413 TaxID=2779401 RepID=UPI001E310538|nr:gamma-glutamylcyclotransferase family protein [Aurantimonas sp. VKM B-3413]MCB8837493.1 gamma-glutamylcyclotransferase [Aurantimonas sp. VKM B-3413]
MTEHIPHDDHPDLVRLADAGEVVAYFGYGSLVNRHTLRTKFLGIRRAKVAGWRRFWLPRDPNVEMALLSVHPDAQEAIDGVVVYDRAEHLPSVDEREAGYARRIVDLDHLGIENAPVGGVPIYIYQAQKGAETAADRQSAILQSYLDAVMQGFRLLYGEVGLRRFVDRTEGFETRVLRDRRKPRYPRPVKLDAGEADLFDRLVLARGARFVDVA